MYDVIAIGEVLIDFTPTGKGKMGNPQFEMNPGGAPINCLACVNSLGGSSAFIGMVGNDMFGDFLIRCIHNAGICCDGIKKTDKAPTTLAFVSISDGGERKFSFIRNPGADLLVYENVSDYAAVLNSKIMHFGSLSLTAEPARDTTLRLVHYAKSKQIPVSYDPNYRPLLWSSEKEAKYWMLEGMALADIVKISDDEVEFLFGYGENDLAKGAQQIMEYGAHTVLITCGRKGCSYFTETDIGFCGGNTVDATDTTGCGDAFLGAYLFALNHKKEFSIQQRIAFANAAGALCATSMGGMPSMPKEADVLALAFP